MPKKIKIETTGDEHKALVQDFKDLKNALKPNFRMYHKMSSEQQELWLEKDNLMRLVVEWAEKVCGGKDDD